MRVNTSARCWTNKSAFSLLLARGPFVEVSICIGEVFGRICLVATLSYNEFRFVMYSARLSSHICFSFNLILQLLNRLHNVLSSGL